MALSKKTLALLAATTLGFGLVACTDSGDNGNGSDGAAGGDGATGGDNYVLANGTEPQNPLIPSNTNEVGGGNIVDLIYSGLVYYDADGEIHNEMAESIEPEGEKGYRVTSRTADLRRRTEITAQHFVDTWNHAVANSHLCLLLRADPRLRGGRRVHGGPRGRRRQDLHHRAQPALRPTSRSVWATPPSTRCRTRHVRTRPASARTRTATAPTSCSSGTTTRRHRRPERGYCGERTAERRHQVHLTPSRTPPTTTCWPATSTPDAIPDIAFSTFEDELGDRAVNQPSAVFQSFTHPGEPRALGRRRGVASSGALPRHQPRGDHRHHLPGHPYPGHRFHLPVLPGYDGEIAGNDVLDYDPEPPRICGPRPTRSTPVRRVHPLPTTPTVAIRRWVDAVTNSIRNTLGIEAVGNPYPDFKSLRRRHRPHHRRRSAPAGRPTTRPW